MKSQQDIERALIIMEMVDDDPRLKLDELMAHKALIDFARWILEKPSKFGHTVFDPHTKRFPNLPEDPNQTFSE
jgi:hypothetical protein